MTASSAQITRVSVRVPAKVNLELCVGPRRADGFHDLATTFHAVDLFAGNAEGRAALVELGLRARALHARAHGVLVVLDDVDHRQVPELRHVEALVDLALVGRAVTEIGQRHVVVAAVLAGKRQPGAERHLGRDDAVAAVEALLVREHVHRAALAAGVAVAAAGELGHDALGVHAAGQHVAVVAVAGDDAVALLQHHLHADHHGLLADVEMAEAADQAHAVHLAGLLLEAADQQHVVIGAKLLVLGKVGERPLIVAGARGRSIAGRARSIGLRRVCGGGHGSPRASCRRPTAFQSIA